MELLKKWQWDFTGHHGGGWVVGFIRHCALRLCISDVADKDWIWPFKSICVVSHI